MRQAAVRAIAAGWADDEATLPLLRDRATTDDHDAVRRAAVRAIAAGWADDEATLPLLRDRAT
ncbi:HEAT repeat domain-containing protein, partial [Frankia umida]|uniref:HEAT repeat domain-containing protein n=1 Tax=Frankia umida TaxID=573489 RepID=UPI00200BA5A3